MCRNRRPPFDPRLRGALAALLFCVGSTLLPGLHQAFHDDHHDHRGGGLQVRVHTDGDDDDGEDTPISGPALDHGHRHRGSGHDHGGQSLFHYGAALGDGAPFWSPLVPLDALADAPGEAAERAVRASSLRIPDVRGPPRLLV